MDDVTTRADESPTAPVLPGYEVLQLLGRGGTGAVWVVRRGDGVRLAAKVVDGSADELDHEVTLLQAIEHEHVLRVVDVLEIEEAGGSRAVLVTELAEGGSLADSLAGRERLTPGELVTVLVPIARALHDLHGHGLVHADLSPGNILLTAEGKPIIADLGVSRLAGAEGDEVWATEAWAAPEVLARESPTPASDVYSLGAIAWAALTGRPPEPAALRPDLADLAPHLSQELRDLVTACLAHTPSARPSAGELALQLWACAPPAPAPVPGSPGGRLAGTHDAADPSVELTRRMRAEAQAEQAGERVATPQHASPGAQQPWWRSQAVSRVVVCGLAAGALCGAAAAWGPSALAWTSHRGHLAAGGAAPGPAVTTRSASPAPRHAATTRSASPSTDATRTRAPAGAASGVPRDPTGATSRMTDLGEHPVEVVQRLVTARAQAWSSGHQLGAALATHSAAYARDEANLHSAARQGVRYRNLRFTARSATVEPGGGDTVRVRATIGRSAYDVTTGTGTTHVPAAADAHVVLRLQWTADGWRIVDWTSG